jgi:Na+-transporting NADH:ubiquinone oxidoreductase subunit E
MDAFLNIVLRAMFLENLALVFLLGMCTYIAVSKNVATAIGLGIAVIVVQIVTVPLNNLLYRYLFAPGALHWAGYPTLDLSFMKYLVFIGVIAALVQIIEVLMERFAPALQQSLGVYMPLLTVNCAILGASLFMVQRDYDFIDSVGYGLGAGLGWALAIVLFAAIRERMRYADLPGGLDDLALAFIMTGFLALAFAGFTGIAL